MNLKSCRKISSSDPLEDRFNSIMWIIVISKSEMISPRWFDLDGLFATQDEILTTLIYKMLELRIILNAVPNRPGINVNGRATESQAQPQFEMAVLLVELGRRGAEPPEKGHMRRKLKACASPEFIDYLIPETGNNLRCLVISKNENERIVKKGHYCLV